MKAGLVRSTWTPLVPIQRNVVEAHHRNTLYEDDAVRRHLIRGRRLQWRALAANRQWVPTNEARRVASVASRFLNRRFGNNLTTQRHRKNLRGLGLACNVRSSQALSVASWYSENPRTALLLR